MESEENIYSKEFIDRLNNNRTYNILTDDPRNQKPKTSLGFKVFLIVAVLFVIALGVVAYNIFEARRKEKIKIVNDLYNLSVKSHDLTYRYQNMINDTQIRFVNKNFYQTLIGLNNDVKEYTKKTYTKEQRAELNAATKKELASLKNIIERLHKAELGETITRIYSQELSAIIDQVLDACYKIVKSNNYSKTFADQVKKHYENLLSIRKDVKDLEEAKAKKY